MGQLQALILPEEQHAVLPGHRTAPQSMDGNFSVASGPADALPSVECQGTTLRVDLF